MEAEVESNEPPQSSGGDEPRREFLRRLARGIAYTAPVIQTFAAPSAASAQATSGMMMQPTLCDWFPALCMLLGFSSAGDSGASAVSAPTGSSELPTAPWSAPAPWEQRQP